MIYLILSCVQIVALGVQFYSMYKSLTAQTKENRKAWSKRVYTSWSIIIVAQVVSYTV